MINEQWFAAELGVVVMSRRSDPRFGETTDWLQNIAWRAVAGTLSP